MLKVFFRRLQHCSDVASSINQASTAQLHQLKAQLAEQMGKPVGLHTMGFPAAISTLGIIVSFALPQLWLGYGILAALNQPAERVFVWVTLVALFFAGINGLTVFMIGKGSMRALWLHLALAVTSLLLTLLWLASVLAGANSSGIDLVAVLLSVAMLLLSGGCILSTAFYKMLLFALHNRAWRQLIRQIRKAHTLRKAKH